MFFALHVEWHTDMHPITADVILSLSDGGLRSMQTFHL